MPFLPCRRFRRARRAALSLIIIATVLAWLGLAPGALAQNVVEDTSPSVTSPAADSPPAVAVTFGTAVDPAVPPSLAVLADDGTPMAIGPARPAAEAPATLTAPVLAPLPAGTYLVLWSAQLMDEDAPRAGSFGFRVGSAPGVPGNATELGAWPAAWAVAARLLVIVGAGAASAGVLMRRQPALSGSRILTWLAPAGAALALVGALLMTVGPGPLAGGPVVVPGSAAAVTLVAAGGALLAIAAVDALRLVSRRSGWVFVAAVIVAAGASLIALGSWSTAVSLPPSIPIVVAGLTLLPLVAGLLVGSALLLATAPQPREPDHTTEPRDRDERLTVITAPEPDSEPVVKSVAGGAARRLSWVAAGLAAAGIVLALLLTGPEIANLGGGSFSITTIVAAILLVVVLSLAVLAGRSPIGQRLLAPAALLATVPIAGLGLLAPAANATDLAGLLAVDLSTSIAAPAGDATLAHLVFQPAAPGANIFAVYVTTDDGAVVASDLPATIRLSALDDPAATLDVPLAPLPTSPFRVGGSNAPHAGWWQAEIVTHDGDILASYPLLLPDPNISGVGPTPPTDPTAAALFAQSLTNLTSLRNVELTINLGSGQGTHGESTIAINVGGDGRPPSYQERSSLYESIIIGDQQWFRIRAEPWQERRAGPINTPANWIITYEHATGFQLGPVVSGPDEPLQLVTFVVPRQYQPRQEPAWFAWWVGTETGQLHQEAMISTQHYMVYRYQGFNTPSDIRPPVAAPVATPNAG